MTEPLRVLVVDDSTFMRGALVRMIERDKRLKVIDTAVNGREGVEKAMRLKPDVITLDVEMPEMNGIEALKAIMAGPKIPCVMVSTLTEAGAKTTLEALELGAVDFIPKALQDKDKNIFRGAEVIHEKLLAAAGAKAALNPALAPRTVVAPPKASAVNRLTGMRVMVVGSSTGGPKALQVFLQGLPANLPVPVVIAQHMPPQFTTALAKRLDETCPPKVVEAENGMGMQAGTVYIAPGGKHLRVDGGVLNVAEEKGESPFKPSVDVLAQSALKAFGKGVLGVMLTGMGNDGAREFLALKRQGAHIIGQDQGSCVVYGMPRAVAENGAVDDVLPLDKIAGRVRVLLGA